MEVEMRYALALIVLLPGALPLWAGPQVVLAPGLVEQVRADPDGFLEDAAGLILGYGRDGRIDAAGIERFLTVERAKQRVAAKRRLMLADLDDDGAVTTEELSVLLAADGAGPRGRLAVAHLRADADGDGTVSAAELTAHARAAAQSLPPGLTDLRTFLAFDRDGDAAVGLAELRRGLADLLPGA
jgi:hypothetical protein